MFRDKVAKRQLVFVALLIASLVILTLFFRESGSGLLHDVQRSSLGVLSPLQSAASRVADPFREAYSYTTGLFSAQSDNRRLERRVERLQGRVVELEESAEENERLKQLLEFQEADIFPQNVDFVTARIIGRSPTHWQDWIRISKGKADGVRLNQPVVGATPAVGETAAGKGLVGKVVAVAEHAAQVQLITDAESRVASVIQGTRAQGVLEGTVGGDIRMDYVERDRPVELKRVVITSGFGQIYPKGIPVGVVESVGEQDVNIYKQIEVSPFVDFGILEEVMVLLTPAAEGESIEEMESVSPGLDTVTEGDR